MNQAGGSIADASVQGGPVKTERSALPQKSDTRLPQKQTASFGSYEATAKKWNGASVRVGEELTVDIQMSNCPAATPNTLHLGV